MLPARQVSSLERSLAAAKDEAVRLRGDLEDMLGRAETAEADLECVRLRACIWPCACLCV